MKTSIQPAALADLRRGFHFYERQEAGLGTYFLDSLYSDIDSLRLFAGIHTIHFGKFYRLLSKRFPFAAYYEVKENTAFVRAVLDLRRDPAWIAGRLEKRN
ncbi:MAG: type II toxin-antitoxin system RelE/ParE family toxin [Verrucomicrobia bacterium]|nr:type II toxin-antitoxin system RelE/ParE family toxin [Verrucomicrobiota bacterium]